MTIRRIAILLLFAFIGWALCGASMGIGLATTTETNALIIHAITAPVVFTILSVIYFRRFGYTTPLQTAAVFLGFVITVDFFLVAMVINRSFEMFASPLGTWIPFALLSTATYVTGRVMEQRSGQAALENQGSWAA